MALDTQLTDPLRREGLAREVVRALNDLRKTAGFEIADRVHVTLAADDTITSAVAEHHDWIAAEVLATTLVIGTPERDAHELGIDGASLQVGITRS